MGLPSLRKDLEIAAQAVQGGGFRYIIKDPRSGEVFEIGEVEYFICRNLDGNTSLEDLQYAMQHHFGDQLSQDLLEAFVRRLDSLGLLTSSSEVSHVSLHPVTEVKPHRLGDPDGFLNVFTACFSWCFSRWFSIVACSVVILAVGLALKHGGRFLHEFNFVRQADPFLVVPILAIFLIYPAGELAKGIACKYYQGQVPEFGVWFLHMLIPRFYFDISDAFWMTNKSYRIRILSAGFICQLLIGAMGLICWYISEAGTGINTFWLLFTFAAIIVFIVNLNPFFQRDGYHLLSVWYEVLDLRNRAVAVAKSWILRKEMPEPLTSGQLRGFRLYGSLWLCFHIIFWCLLLGFIGYYLTDEIKGLGALIFIAILYFRFEEDIHKQLMKVVILKKMLTGDSPAFIRMRLLGRLGLVIVLIIVALLPYPFMVGGDFRLLPTNQVGIRSQVTSEIETIFVTEGQWVKKGDPVVKLTGRDQKKRAEATKAALDETQARLDLLRKGPKPEAIAAARQEVQTAAKSLQYSTMSADRYAKLIKDNATSAQAYENALKIRDLDRERLELAKRNLELVQSGAREEEIKAVEAEVRRLQVELRHAEEDLQLSLLVSPIEGRIITPNLEEKRGQVLLEGDLFAVIEDAQRIYAEIEVPEKDVGEVHIGSKVTLKAWGYPTQAFKGEVVEIAPVAYEKSLDNVFRTLSDREMLYGRRQSFREEGKVVRVISELSNEDGFLKTDMTGYAKIDCDNRPVVVAFTRWLVRFIMVEVWSWIP